MKNKNHHSHRFITLFLVLLLLSFSGKLMSYTSIEHTETNIADFHNTDYVVCIGFLSGYQATYSPYSPAHNSSMLTVVATELSDQHVMIEWSQKEMHAGASFSIYRTSCETGELHYLGNSTTNSFIDNSWGAVGSGVYKWGVMDESTTIAFSNCLDKDMITQVSVTVQTNSQDSPAGTQVEFTNVSEPALGLIYETQLDDSGYYLWEEFRKGTYEIMVVKSGFSPVSVTNYLIDEPEDFQWVLEELFLPVEDLFVNPNGFAVWSSNSSLNSVAGGFVQKSADDAENYSNNSGKQQKQIKTFENENKLKTSNKRYHRRAITGYKVWLDGVFVGETQDTCWQYDEMNLVSGQSYLTEIAAVYTTGVSEKEQYSWNYVPCADYAGPQLFTVEMLNYYNNDVLLTWSDIEPMQLVRISQNPGEPEIAYWQTFGNGYGVAYDLSNYPDAVLSSIGFHHMSYGLSGIWDYKIHIYNWENRTLIESFGPYQTTGDDQWETDVSLSSLNAGGISTIAILIEPLGHSPSDAYPCLSADQAADPQGSIYGSLSDVNAISSSTLGNFLMELYIYTHYGTKQSASTEASLVKAPMAKSSMTNTFDNPNSQLFDVHKQLTDPFAGANIYRNGELIAEMLTDTFYVDHQVFGDVYNYCIRYVYESGAMTCEDAYCVELEVPCASPKNIAGSVHWDDVYGAKVEWASPDITGWLYYDDGTNVEGIGGPDALTWAIKFDPAQLAAYEGTSLTKIVVYNKTTADKELRIYEGENAATLVHSQMLSGLENEQWQEFFLTETVLIDITKELWIAVHATDGANEPAACGPSQNQPNGDLISMDGLTWEHLSDYGLDYTWNLRGYVTTATGETASLPVEFGASSNHRPLKAQLAGSVHQVVPTNSLQPDYYNLYRSPYGENEFNFLISVPGDTYEYFDSDVVMNSIVCYQVTAVYVNGEDTCESAPAYALQIPDEDFWCIWIYYDLKEIDDEAIKMYPNPAIHSLTIEGDDMRSIIVVNAIAQPVFESSIQNPSITLNTSSFEPGIYLIRIETAKGVVNKRLVVMRQK
ncbi:MAG: T9SS type A sorting domain-containing protein [Bacteroidales bacterium]|nr:T9SS type A sorting domain-containing protein [Bacteroidales bacterium]